MVFGKWLVNKGMVSPEVLQSALDIQNAEKSDTLRTSSRLLGQILLEDFNVFRNRVELNKALVEFEKVKAAVASRQAYLDKMKNSPPAARMQPHKSTSKLNHSASPPPVQDRAIFGQFLIEKGKINSAILHSALEIQNEEANDTLRASHRLLGEILMDDFNVFSSRVELNRLLIDFNQFKAQLEARRTELMSLSRS